MMLVLRCPHTPHSPWQSQRLVFLLPLTLALLAGDLPKKYGLNLAESEYIPVLLPIAREKRV